MERTFFAVFRDQYAPGTHIRIFPERLDAEAACDRWRSEDAEVIRFSGSYDLMDGKERRPIYLAVTMEDHGYRIHGAFCSLMGLHTYRSIHVQESPCHWLIAWPGNTETASQSDRHRKVG